MDAAADLWAVLPSAVSAPRSDRGLTLLLGILAIALSITHIVHASIG